MTEERMGRVFRAFGVFAIVLAIVASSQALHPLILFGKLTFRESLWLALVTSWKGLPFIALEALVITVFAMNRIRNVLPIALAAVLIAAFISLVPNFGLLGLYGSRNFWRLHNLLEGAVSENFAFLLPVLVLFLLAFAGAFLIIKLVAGVEKRLIARSAENV